MADANANAASFAVDEEFSNAWQSSRPTPCQLVELQAGKMALVCGCEKGSMLKLEDEGREHEMRAAQSSGW
jgi:hypothetical protein